MGENWSKKDQTQARNIQKTENCRVSETFWTVFFDKYCWGTLKESFHLRPIRFICDHFEVFYGQKLEFLDKFD